MPHLSVAILFASVTRDHGGGSHFDGHFIEQVSDGLETLEIGVFCNTFSERGKRQNEEVRRFKEADHAQENKEKYRLFCKDLIQCQVCGLEKREIISAILCEKGNTAQNSAGMRFTWPFTCLSLVQSGCKQSIGCCLIKCW